MKGKLGMIIDGTGHNVEKIEKQKKELGLAGYDTYMVFVNTTLEVALERNSKRSRVLPEKIVTQSWNDVQKNIGRFQQMFGRDFVVVDNSDTLDEKQAAKKFSNYVKKYADKWVRSPIKITVKPGTLLYLFFNSVTSCLSSALNSAAAFFPSIRIISFKKLKVRCRASYTFL